MAKGLKQLTHKKLSSPRPQTVYVIGAGFSAGLTYPLVHDLLIRLWGRLDAGQQVRLSKVISFHHPGFQPARRTSFPTIEHLLSEMLANEQLFSASRAAPGNFVLKDLISVRRELLLAVASWFHEIHTQTFSNTPVWLTAFRERVVRPGDTIISFNWDLVLDQLLFGTSISPANYGFGNRDVGAVTLLKPHGSLNWYEGSQGKRIKEEHRFELANDPNDGVIYAFRHFRSPRSKSAYMPLIIPPVYNKDFSSSVFQHLWKSSVADLSVAKKVVFLGYSLPDADLHARFILRCGFHNQLEGEIEPKGTRSSPSGPSKVIIVNPDQGAANRIEKAVGNQIVCDWQPTTVDKWINTHALKS